MCSALCSSACDLISPLFLWYIFVITAQNEQTRQKHMRRGSNIELRYKDGGASQGIMNFARLMTIHSLQVPDI